MEEILKELEKNGPIVIYDSNGHNITKEVLDVLFQAEQFLEDCYLPESDEREERRVILNRLKEISK